MTFKRRFTDEERVERARERSRQYYAKRKDDPEYRAWKAANVNRWKEANPDKAKETSLKSSTKYRKKEKSPEEAQRIRERNAAYLKEWVRKQKEKKQCQQSQ